MITLNKYADKPDKAYIELYGLSTDNKPIEKFKNTLLKNGSIFYEMDTKKAFIYDEENHQWWEM